MKSPQHFRIGTTKLRAQLVNHYMGPNYWGKRPNAGQIVNHLEGRFLGTPQNPRCLLKCVGSTRHNAEVKRYSTVGSEISESVHPKSSCPMHTCGSGGILILGFKLGLATICYHVFVPRRELKDIMCEIGVKRSLIGILSLREMLMGCHNMMIILSRFVWKPSKLH